MLSTRGDRVPWRLFKTLPGPASFVHIAPFKCQAKVPSLLANCTTCTEYYNLLANKLRGFLSRWLFAWIGFLFFLLLVKFPPNNAIISNGQWKIRARTERRGSPPPQRSNTANVIYVMCTLYPPPNTIVKPPTSSISFPLTISIWIGNWIFMSNRTRTHFQRCIVEDVQNGILILWNSKVPSSSFQLGDEKVWKGNKDWTPCFLPWSKITLFSKCSTNEDWFWRRQELDYPSPG